MFLVTCLHVNPRHTCTARVTVIWSVCVSVIQHFSSQTFENNTTYLMESEKVVLFSLKMLRGQPRAHPACAVSASSGPFTLLKMENMLVHCIRPRWKVAIFLVEKTVFCCVSCHLHHYQSLDRQPCSPHSYSPDSISQHHECLYWCYPVPRVCTSV